MNVTVETAALVKALRRLEKIVPAKPVQPVFSNVLIRTHFNVLHLSTTNIGITITMVCPAIITEPGQVTAPVKMLLELLREIPDAQTHFSIDKGKLRVEAGAFTMRVQTLPADDFPPLPVLPAGGITIPGDAFREMIKRVRYAISDADQRYLTKGALLTIIDELIVLAATDGKRVSITATHRTETGPFIEGVIIPVKTLDALLSLDGDVLFTKDARHLFFVTGDLVLASQMLDGAFPDIHRVIPKNNPHTATISRLALLAAIKRVCIASPESREIRCELVENGISLHARNAIVGDALEHMAIQYQGPPLTLALQWTFVVNFLNAASEPLITLAIKDDVSMTLWTDTDTFHNAISLMRV
jgi:DNA polymerase-3 subunit beta